MVFPRAVEAVVFDMDGLLFDTESLFFEAMRAAGLEAGHDVPRKLFLSLLGCTREHNYARLREYFGEAVDAEEFHARAREHMLMLLEQQLRLKTGVLEILDLLDGVSMPRAIATSSLRASVDHHLAAFDLSTRFHAIVAHGDYLHGKPHPAPFLTAAARLGVDPAHCLALEDSHNGVRSAAAAGMMTVMVPDLLEPTDEMRQLCAFVAFSLHDVQRLLERESWRSASHPSCVAKFVPDTL